MPPKGSKRKQTQTNKPTSTTTTTSSTINPTTNTNTNTNTTTTLPSAGLLLTCDAPTKQYIKRLDDLKSHDKKFIIEDLDTTHLLINIKAKDEIMTKVEEWMNENVWTNIDSKGDFDT